MRRPLIATYEPKPIDTSGVVFDDEMAGLAERLAANAHEIWAQQRIRDGWTYGPTRDDEAKEHPCLVPYGELPDSEKEYDRVMGGPRLRVFSSRKDPTESLDYRSTFLGASVLSSDLRDYLLVEQPYAVVLSCAMTTYLLGARHGIRESHDAGGTHSL